MGVARRRRCVVRMRIVLGNRAGGRRLRMFRGFFEGRMRGEGWVGSGRFGVDVDVGDGKEGG